MSSLLVKRFKQIRFWWRYFKARLNPPASEREFRRIMGVWYWLYRFKHQYPVWVRVDRKTKRLRLDFAVLLDNGRMVNLEIDGPQHYPIEDWARDMALTKLGWEIYRFKTSELKDPAKLRRRVLSVLKRGGLLPN